MKKYLASFESGWDLVINANSYKEALKDARGVQKEYGKLYYLRLMR